MSAALVHEAGFGVNFIPTLEGIKTCDLVIESYKTEVETLLDTYKEGVRAHGQFAIYY